METDHASSPKQVKIYEKILVFSIEGKTRNNGTKQPSVVKQQSSKPKILRINENDLHL